MQDNNPQNIDKRIQQAQRKGLGVYLFSGGITLLVIIGFALWLFFIKGYKLIIGPSDALPGVQVDLVSGIAWVSNARVYSLGGEVIFTVRAETFEIAQYTINQQSPSNIEIMLLPRPAVIRANVGVAGANKGKPSTQYLKQSQWYLNGSIIHVGDSLEYITPPGNYQLEVTNPYYESASQSLQLARAQEVSLAPELTEINGRIHINSQPQGANLSINGQAQGITPLSVEVMGGEYAIEITSDDYQTINDSIAVQARFLQPTRNYQLLAKLAVLNISATPSDGLLLINNVEAKLGRNELSANSKHSVVYQKAGHSTFSKTISFDKQASINLDIALQALFGNVNFTSNTPAKLTLNGAPLGQAPISKRLPSMPHTLEASAQGYRSVKREFVPSANTTTNLDITLLTEFDARRQEGKPLFVSQLGINMLLFRGDAFTMGSAPNEPGRRRNEHLIDVDFKRQFWVSDKEITQAQFSSFLNAKQRSKSKLPVTGVSWLEAAQYCNWLSEQEGLPLFYRFQNGRYVGINNKSVGYRLPTEAEWEWLAKKSKRALSTVYVWGNQEKLRDKQGNFADKTRSAKQLIYFDDYQDGHGDAAEVGSFQADRAGLYDLDGNVSEWVHDFYTTSIPDTSKRYVDYLGSVSGDSWVIKGGNFETGRLRELRAAFREFSVSGKPTLGFRIARYQN